jgi:CubicO group peptidase (beta-lactamase class C family)
MFEFVGRHELRRAPGEYEYSNLGVGLLGHLLATKAGKSYEELLVDRIAGPLKMNDTRVILSDEQRKRLAPGYNAALKSEKNWDLNALVGAGGIRSTANDLMKLVEASLTDDKTPVVEAIHEAWKPRFGKPGQIGVGLCWHIARDGVTRWHNGETGGYTAAVFIYKRKKIGVVVVCNTANDKTTELAEKIIQSALGMSPKPIAIRKAIKLAPDVLKQYEGTYALSLLFAITITSDDGKLMAQATGQDKAQIFPESETKFFYKVVDAQIDFEKGKDGKVEKLILHQNGQDMPGMKLPGLKKQI